MRTGKPTTIWILCGIFVWSLTLDLQKLFVPDSLDYEVLSHVGLESFWGPLFLGLLLLDALAILMLLRPRPYGMWVILTTLAGWVTANGLVGIVILREPEVFRAALEFGFEQRGREIDERLMEIFVSLAGRITALVLVILPAFGWGWLVIANHRYFRGTPGGSGARRLRVPGGTFRDR